MNKHTVFIILAVLFVILSFFTNPRDNLIPYQQSLYDIVVAANGTATAGNGTSTTDTKITDASNNSHGVHNSTRGRDYNNGPVQDSSSATGMAVASGYGLDEDRNKKRPASKIVHLRLVWQWHPDTDWMKTRIKKDRFQSRSQA